MNKKNVLILIGVILLLVVIGIGGYFLFIRDNEDNWFNEGTAINCFSFTNYITSYKLNTDTESVNKCVTNFTTMHGSETDNGLEKGKYTEFCNGTGALWGNTFDEYLKKEIFLDEEINYLIDNEIITDVVNGGITITDYDSECGGKNPVIPKEFDAGKIIAITGYSSDEGKRIGAFEGKGIESIKLPNTIITIGNNAFSDNRLTSLKLGNSIQIIGEESFSNNLLEEVKIGKGIKLLAANAFTGNSLLKEVTIDEECLNISINNYQADNISYKIYGRNNRNCL